MAVFTPVQMSDISPWLQKRGMVAREVCAIGEGIENTNYRIIADNADNDGGGNNKREGGRRTFVFTIFELWDIGQVRYYAALTNHLAAAGLPVPSPVFAPSLWNDDKPCILVPFADSDGWRQNPTPDECRTMGMMIAKLHLAAAGFNTAMENPRGHSWRRGIAEKLRGVLPPAQMRMIDDELSRDSAFAAAPLPFGACHCDLFRNNVLWRGGDIAAVIDFYFGGDDALIFDLAIAACDWCFNNNNDGGGFDYDKLDALFDGYRSMRQLCPLERRMLAEAFCVAALRFWLSRLYDAHFPRRAEVLQSHDPRYFEDILSAARMMREKIAAMVGGNDDGGNHDKSAMMIKAKP